MPTAQEIATAEARLNAQLQPAYAKGRPKLSAENVGEYLDWIVSNLDRIRGTHLATHMQACELVIRTRATDAQNKTTQHTLVEQGVIDQPNT